MPRAGAGLTFRATRFPKIPGETITSTRILAGIIPLRTTLARPALLGETSSSAIGRCKSVKLLVITRIFNPIAEVMRGFVAPAVPSTKHQAPGTREAPNPRLQNTRLPNISHPAAAARSVGGFTLIELILVMTVLTIAVSVTAPALAHF